jgi:hypothetical protein
MNLAQQLMTTVTFATGKLHPELPSGFISDPRHCRPVIVKIGKLGLGAFDGDGHDAWTFGKVVGGGKDDGRSVRISADVSAYKGGYILCAVPDPASYIVAPMLLHMQVTRGGGTFTSTADEEVIYTGLSQMVQQHAIMMHDIFDAFANQAFIPETELKPLTYRSRLQQRKLAEIRRRYELSRSPFYDEFCPEGFVAWIARRVLHGRLDPTDIGYLISRGKHKEPVEVVNLTAISADPRICDRSNLEIWGLPEAHTHESFLTR